MAQRKVLAKTLRLESNARQREARHLQAVLDALPAEVALLAKDGTIVAVNEGWRRFAVVLPRISLPLADGEALVPHDRDPAPERMDGAVVMHIDIPDRKVAEQKCRRASACSERSSKDDGRDLCEGPQRALSYDEYRRRRPAR